MTIGIMTMEGLKMVEIFVFSFLIYDMSGSSNFVFDRILLKMTLFRLGSDGDFVSILVSVSHLEGNVFC